MNTAASSDEAVTPILDADFNTISAGKDNWPARTITVCADWWVLREGDRVLLREGDEVACYGFVVEAPAHFGRSGRLYVRVLPDGNYFDPKDPERTWRVD